MLLGLLLGFIVFIGTSHGARAMNGGRVGGDFPAFYGAATIVRDGAGADLYDRDRQRQAQRDLLPDEPGGWLDFAYPPFVAVLLVPLAALPFKAAFSIYTAAQAGACALAVGLAATVSPRIRANQIAAAAVALSFYPLMRALLGGQNTGFSLLCAVGVAVELSRSRDFAAGLWAGAWLFKPQLALPVSVLVGGRRGWRFVGGLALVGALYYTLGALVGGLAWPAWWWREGVLPFAAVDPQFDLANGISLREVGIRLGAGSLGTAAGAIVLAAAAWRCWSRAAAALALATMAIVAALLGAAHTLYYDAGLLVISFWLAVEWRDRTIVKLAISTWALATLQVIGSHLPIAPAFASVLTAAAIAWRSSRMPPGTLDATVAAPADAGL